ncbi:HTH-like domain protein [Burkholderia pseudomallei MSHR7500]|nr:HTH-like domain protein [Burkholderia pseudomallei MSHR7500]
MRDRYRTSLTKTCALFGMSRSLYRYQSVARDSSALLMRIKEITATRVHYGYRRVHVVLRREGWRDNCKRVYRLYRAEGLSLRHKRPRRNKSARLRQPKHIVTAINGKPSINDALPMVGRRSDAKCPRGHMHSDRDDRETGPSKQTGGWPQTGWPAGI